MHVKPSSQDPSNAGESAPTFELIGSVGLRMQDAPDWPNPPPHPSNTTSKPIHIRAIGYSFVAAAWGKGYATESVSALLNAYSAFRAKVEDEASWVEAAVGRKNPKSIRVLEKSGFAQMGWKEEEETVFLNGGRNPRIQIPFVLALRQHAPSHFISPFTLDEQANFVSLHLEWQEPGYWVYGRYV